jgi:carboxyl-terminal processing protease
MEKVLKTPGIDVRARIVTTLFGLLAFSAFAAAPTSVGDAQLAPSAKHEKIGELVTEFVQKSHYEHSSVDDKLSALVLDRYIESLDGNRMYLLKSDVDAFQRYRNEIDDMVRSEPMDPIFDMFEVYRTRARDRLNFALLQLETEPDFTVDEEFEFDREKSPWATTEGELDDIWRKRVKNDALGLALTDKEWPEIQETLSKRYARFLKRMDQIKSDDVFETFMNAFAHTLDPHSSYLSPRSSEEYRIQMSLSYFGIGASLQIEDDYVKVAGIIPGGPAAIDGSLQPEDRITAVAQGEDGELIDVIGWRLDDVVQLIRGPANSVVQLQVLSGNALPGAPQKTISLMRNQVKLEEQAAKSKIVTIPRDGRDWSIGVIEVPSFYRDYRALSNGDKDYTSTTKDVKKLIDELEKQGIDGLIVDLRNNGGGHLTEATALSGLFIDNGPVVQLRSSNGRISRLDDPDPVPRVAYNGPLAVLVNRYSASASEIFAAAIQDYARGVIIGQQTFGKGTVQNLYSLDQYVRHAEDEEGLGQLTLTIGKYYRVTGESTQHRGVNPDIALPSPIDAELVGESVRDSALPWDTIRTARFRAGAPLDSTIVSLTSNHLSRSKDDPDYRYLLDDIQDIAEVRSRTNVSLHIEARKKEREDELNRRLARENERRAASGLAALTTPDELDDLEEPDIHLDQAAAIVTDLAELRQVDTTAPAQTAQMRE